MSLGGSDIRTLPFLGAAAYQDDQPFTVASEIDPVARAEVDPVFEHARTY
jgi:hypothetical protein